MPPPIVVFYYDLVDPLSYAQEQVLRAAEGAGWVGPVERRPLELRPPPMDLIDPADDQWLERWSQARAALAELAVPGPGDAPWIVPWSRKAHELVLHAAEDGRGDGVRQALMRAAVVEGRDIGRVDVLVELARGEGLDPSHAKAVLDVDRHTAAVEAARTEAVRLGVAAPPALVMEGVPRQGFHNREALRTFLSPAP